MLDVWVLELVKSVPKMEMMQKSYQEHSVRLE
jgi:hypothetical protein